MWEHIKFKSTNASGSFAAAFVVLSTGLFGLILCTLLWVENDLYLALILIGGYFALGMLFVSLINGRSELPSTRHFFFGRRHRNAPPCGYTPRMHRARPAQYGTNRPPTVEEIRELADGPRNWVPSKLSGGRRSPRCR